MKIVKIDREEYMRLEKQIRRGSRTLGRLGIEGLEFSGDRARSDFNAVAA